MAKKVHIGDIVEIPTANGTAYAQLSHIHPTYGALLRVLPGCFESRPIDFNAIVHKHELFFVFFPLQAAVNRRIFYIVGKSPLPDFAKPFPLFRAGAIHPKTGRVEDWWLWDGSTH